MREFVLWDQQVNFVQIQALLLILTKIKTIQKPEYNFLRHILILSCIHA